MPDVILPHTDEIHNEAIRANFEVIGQLLNLHTAIAVRKTPQAVAPAAFVPIKLETVLFDPDELFNLATGEYNVPVDGAYLCVGQAEMVVTEAKKVLIVGVLKNGGEGIRGSRIESVGAGGELSGVVGGIIQCKQGDKLAMYIFNTGGASNLAAESPVKNYLGVVRVG